MARRPERLRLAGNDYSSPGAYFVTICLQDRLCLLGEIMRDTCLPTEAGHMVLRWWEQLPNLGSNVELDEYVVMPNHLHGVIILVDADLHAGPENHGAHVGAPLPETAVGADLCVGPDQQGAHIGAPPRGQRSEPTSLPRLIQWFKTMTTHEYMGGVKASGWPRFRPRLWQGSCYDHIIRTERELIAIRRNIRENPLRWAMDEENPSRGTILAE